MANNTEALGKCLLMLSGLFQIELDDIATEAYRIGLAGLSPSQINAATRAVLTSPSFKFMPKPGELRMLAVTYGRGVESQIDAAWLLLSRAIQRHGSSSSVNFRDGLINATVRILGGWSRCCELPTEEFEKWYRRDFSATYSRLLLSGASPDVCGYLRGENERHNSQWVGRTDWGKGDTAYALPAPEEIGCEYEPLLISATGQSPALNHRPTALPQIEMKKVNT